MNAVTPTYTEEDLAWGREFVRRREAAKRESWEQERQRSRGVCWSGMGPGPLEPRTPEELEREAISWATRRANNRAEDAA